MQDGWIKLYRRIHHSRMYKSLTSVQRDVMIQCLILASHEESEWEWGAKTYRCQPGQFITSLESLRACCARGTTVKQVRGGIAKLKKWGFLAEETAKTGRLITIINWGTYQAKGQTGGHVQGHDGGKRWGTYQEGKNGQERKKKKEPLPLKNPGFSDRFMSYIWPYYLKVGKGTYRNRESQEVALGQLYEWAGGDEQEAVAALKYAVANSYKGFQWYFKTRDNGATDGRKNATTPDQFGELLDWIRTNPDLRRGSR